MPKFPTSIWDGFTGNPQRKDPFQESAPDFIDWNVMVGELLSMQAALGGAMSNLRFIAAGAQTIAADVAPWIYVPYAITLVNVAAMAKTAPVTGTLTFDILYSIDGGATFTTIWSTSGNRVKLLSTAHIGTQNVFDVAAIPAGAILRLDVKAIGSGTAGSDVTVQLFTK